MRERRRPAGFWAGWKRSAASIPKRPENEESTDAGPHWRDPGLPRGENGLTHHEFAHAIGLGRVSPLFQRHRW